MQVQKGDILIALKAINLTPALGNSDRAVAAALLDHFNRKTGQCDPGIKRLARLLGISERTIFRSLKRIEADRLFRRVRHGGHLNRNSYEPNWPRFREIEAIWSAGMKPLHSAPTKLSPGYGQGCQLARDNGVDQTCRSNLSKATCPSGLPTWATTSSSPDIVTRSLERTSSQEASLNAAERRWWADLHEQFAALPTTYAEIISAIDGDIRHSATGEERKQRGAGLRYIVRRLRLGRLQDRPL